MYLLRCLFNHSLLRYERGEGLELLEAEVQDVGCVGGLGEVLHEGIWQPSSQLYNIRDSSNGHMRTED